jgi:predicted PurR-regulated permease PerM
MAPERVVLVRPRTVATAAVVLVGVATIVWLVWISRRVLMWTFIALFLALALSPAVAALQRRGFKRRGAAAAVVYLLALAIIAAVGALFVPRLVDQVNGFLDAAPRYVHDLTTGRGPFGFLQTKYHVVDRVRHAVQGNAGGSLAGGASAALQITQGIVSFVAATVTIAVLTFFMLLEGPAWVDRGLELVPAESRPRWRRLGERIQRLVGGYVTGNLLISAIAGTTTTIVLLVLGVPFALALGLFVAILDLIPLAGATLAAIVITLVALSHSVTAAIVVLAFFVVYQQVENHILQPMVYGRTVQLSPLVILFSVLIGAQVAGIVGALSAIPVAGTIQLLLTEWLERRRDAAEEAREPDRFAREREPVADGGRT